MRITLDKTEPPIWREIEIPASFSFYQLHIAIQDAMGWENEHLYKFRIKDPIKKVNVEIPPPPISGLVGKYDPDTQKLAKYINPGNKVFAYEYDFGDCWVHIVTMKKMFKAEQGVKYPRCTGGERACPPENTGGVNDYYEILAAGTVSGDHAFWEK